MAGFTFDQVKEILAINQKTTMDFIRLTVEMQDKKIMKINEDIQEIKHSLNFEESSNKEKLAEIESRIMSINEDITNLHKKPIQTNNMTDIVDKINDLENRSRRNNLRFNGVIESGDESWEETERKIRSVIEDKLDIKLGKNDIERAHRIGDLKYAQEKNRPRTAIAKFNNYKLREDIFKQAAIKELGSTSKIYINEDYSESTMKKRSELVDKLKEIRKAGNYAVIRYDKLVTRNWLNKKEELGNH